MKKLKSEKIKLKAIEARIRNHLVFMGYIRACIISILILSSMTSCTNIKLKKKYKYHCFVNKDRKYNVHSLSEIKKNINFKKNKKAYLNRQVQRSFLSGVLMEFTSLYINRSFGSENQMKENLFSRHPNSFTEVPKKEALRDLKNYEQKLNFIGKNFFPPNGYSLRMTFDTVSFKSSLKALSHSSNFLRRYTFIKVNIDKTAIDVRKNESIFKDTVIYFENKNSYQAITNYTVSPYEDAFYYSDPKPLKFYTKNLILVVKNNFFQNLFLEKFKTMSWTPFLDLSMGRCDYMMYLSERFLNYGTSVKELWKQLSKDKDNISKQAFITYFKIALYSDYQPKDFKVINDKGGVYQYTFYSKRYKQRAQLKFNADRPHVFDIKLLDYSWRNLRKSGN